MLDGEQYFRAFPDESPSANQPLSSAELIAALTALQREFQQFVAGAEAHEAGERAR